MNKTTKANDQKETLEEAYKKMFPHCYEEFVELHNRWKHDPPPQSVVYVLEMGNNTVKIGVTKDIERRKNQLRGISGLGIKAEWHTDLMNRSDAYKVEHLCHDEFKEQRTLGEYFNVPFDDACFAVALYGIIVIEGEKYKAEHGIKRRY